VFVIVAENLELLAAYPQGARQRQRRRKIAGHFFAILIEPNLQIAHAKNFRISSECR